MVVGPSSHGKKCGCFGIEALEEERKVMKIATIPEVVRIIVSEYCKAKAQTS